MIKVLFASIMELSSFQLFGQNSGSVKGMVEENGKPVEFVNVFLTSKADTNKVITGSTTDSTGHFSIDKISFGNYVLKTQSLGYFPYKADISLAATSSILDLKTIAIKSDNIVLQSVNVVSFRKSIKRTEQGFVVAANDNFTISAKMKAVNSDENKGGGLVWRYIDNNNYYVARYNPLENNFRFYRVVNGSRKQLKSVEGNIKSGEWFTMSIEMDGNKITCSLNGSKLIETNDDTFTQAGNIGLWTKADAQSYFDDVSVHCKP